MPNRIGALLAGAALAFAVCAADAQRPLTVVTEPWPPFRIDAPWTERGLAGIDMDVLDALAEETGLKFLVRRHPWSRALELIRTGDADLIMGVAYSAERNEYIRYIPTSYVSVKPAIYVKKGEEARIRSYESLRGLSIGHSPKTVYFEPFDSDKGLRKLSIPMEEQILQMLHLGRIDAAIGTEPNIQWDIFRLGLRDLLVPAEYQPPIRTKLFIGASRKSSADGAAETIDAALQRLLAAGKIDAILERYR
jgi:polar amino acid transport system substrate-binding protein